MVWRTPLSVLAFGLLVNADSQVPFRHGQASKAITSELSDYAKDLMKAFRVPGLALAVVHADKPVEFGSWGKSSEDGDPTSEETLNCVASNSKAFVSAAMGILIDDFANGRNVTPLPSGVDSLTWKSKAKSLLPGEWKLQDEWADSAVTIADMLGHVSGMPRHDYSYSHEDSIDDLVGRLRYLRPAWELREKFNYNNQMYMTASYIISRYSNQSYPSFVKERIFGPLNMSSSTYYPQEAFDSGKLSNVFTNSAGLHKNETRLIPYFLQSWDDRAVRLNAGAGGVITSTSDLSKWIKMLLNKGTDPTSGKVIIPEAALDRVTTGYSVSDGKAKYPELSAEVYGAGWWRSAYQGHEIVFHSGSVPGFSSYLVLYPNDGIGIVALSNGDAVHSALMSLAYRVAEDTLKLQRIDWPKRFHEKPESIQKNKASEPTPLSTAVEVPISTFAGTYTNPGYGTFTLCATPAIIGSPCASTLADYAAADPRFNDTSSNTLYASFPRMWSSHLRLAHHNGTVFKVTIDRLFPHGYGKDRSGFLTSSDGDSDTDNTLAEFLLVEGFSVGVGVWGAGGGPAERIPGKPAESSEAWFTRVP